MAADLASIAQTFVAALVSDSAAREAFAAAMASADHARAAEVVNQYAAVDPPLAADDMTALLPLISSALNASRAGGASALHGSIMMGELGGSGGSIMPADKDPKP